MSGESKPAAGSQSPLINRPDMSIKGTTSVEGGRESPDGDRPNMSLRLVLVGKTGAGKSTSANTILGRRVFLEALCATSVTRQCRKEGGKVAERGLVLVDTPGLFDTARSEEGVRQEISKCINMTAPGPHAIIIVVRLGAFTREERCSVEKVRALFGEDADRHTMVLGDQLNCSIEEYITEAPPDLQHLLELCGGRYHVFDNTNMKNRTQVLQLLEIVDKMVADNSGQFYTNDMYLSVEAQLNIKEQEISAKYTQELKQKESEFDEERRRLHEVIAELKHSGQEKDQKVKELKHLVHKKNQEIMEYRRFYQELLLVVRPEAERISTVEMVSVLFGKLQMIN